MIRDNLEKYCRVIYIVILFTVIGFIVYITCTFNNNTYSVNNETALTLYDKWEIYGENGTYIGSCNTTEISTDSNETLIMKGTLPNSLPYDYSMGLLTIHLDVHIYADGVLIYSFTKGDGAFGNTAGYGYHFISQLCQYAGNDIEIHISSPYGITHLPNVEFGSAKDLLFKQLSIATVPFSIAVLTFVIGILILCYGIYTIIKAHVNRSFIFLGFFAMTLGIYTANEQPIFLLMTGNHVLSAYLSFISLMMLPMPFILFMKELYTNNRHMIWYILIFINFVNLIVSTILQIFDIINYRESLSMTHLVYLVTIVAIIIMTIYELVKFKLTESMKLNIICISVVVIFLTIDIILYYFSYTDEPSLFGNVSFLFYIIVVGLHTIKTNTLLIEKGRKAEEYRTLAYRDNLTGIRNRTSHDSFLSNADTTSHQYIIGMMDLNNLKYYNDNLGHEIGDKYITTSATLICQAFGEIADNHCYRIGGDEFCVILQDKTIEQFITCHERLNKLIDEFNSSSDDLKIHIAVGYVQYDSAIDHNLKETRSRADAMMYKNKFMMKGQLGR